MHIAIKAPADTADA